MFSEIEGNDSKLSVEDEFLFFDALIFLASCDNK